MKKLVVCCLMLSVLCSPVSSYAKNKEVILPDEFYYQKINSELKKGNTIIKFEDDERESLESNQKLQLLLRTMAFPSTFSKPLIYINYPEENKFGYNFLTTLNKNQILKSYSYAEEILNMIPSDFSKLEKIEFVYRYVSLLPYVDFNRERETSNQYAYSLFNGGAVCSAKADLVNALLTELNIPSVLIIIGDDEQLHALNLVFYEGKWYYLDSTYAGARGISAPHTSAKNDILQGKIGSVSTKENEEEMNTPLEMTFSGYDYFLFGEQDFAHFYDEMKHKNQNFEIPLAEEYQIPELNERLNVKSNPKSYRNSVLYNDLNFNPSELNILK